MGCLATVGITGAAARAADQKIYPGALCQPSNNTLEVDRTASGKMLNRSTSRQTWLCPIVRDQVGTSKNIESAWIRYIDDDHHNGEEHEVVCKVAVVSPASVEFAVQKSSGSDPAERVFNFPALFTPGEDRYLLDCDVPGKASGERSGIVAYSVIEETS